MATNWKLHCSEWWYISGTSNLVEPEGAFGILTVGFGLCIRMPSMGGFGAGHKMAAII